MNDWDYDASTETWLFGTEQRGAGVYFEDGWMVNICHPEVSMIIGCGPFNDKLEAMQESLKKLKDLDDKSKEVS